MTKKTPSLFDHASNRDILDWLEATSAEDPSYCMGSHEKAAEEIRRLRDRVIKLSATLDAAGEFLNGAKKIRDRWDD